MPKRVSSLNQQQEYIDVISIGTLYDPKGRWHKKYWSSSRGRERHPYPIGYEATRTYNGVNSTMRILQGDTGPLFQITSVDGHTASGPTPDIAWKEFQRASSPLAKSIRTKRLSASIDGPEFFGFKNHTVQQLLRQLVTVAASQSPCVSNAHQNKQFPKQRVISSNDCSQDKGAEKRKMDCMESIGNNKPKKVRPLKDTDLSTSYHNNDICKYINSLPAAAPATADCDKSHHIKRHEVDDEKICSSLAADTLDGCEEVTMSMMKLLLPQAVPFLRKACGTKIQTADVDFVDGMTMNTSSISKDHNKTQQAIESYKDINPASFNTKFDEHNDLDKLLDVPDSCDELEDNACIRDSYDELDNNAHVSDSCDKLDENAYAPDSCDEVDANACFPDCNAYVSDSCDEPEDNVFAPDICIELDKNAYVPDSCDELDENAKVLYSPDKLDENAQVPDSCDEPNDKEIVPDSPQEFNENNYVSNSFDRLDGNFYVPKSCVDMDEEENVPISAKQLTQMDVKKCEGKAVTCSLESEKILSAKYGDMHETTKETSNPEIFSKEGVVGARFCEEEGNNNNKDYLKHQGQLNLATQQQIKNTNQTSHIGIANASTDELHGGICPVFNNGNPKALDKCAFKENLNAGSYGACSPSHNLYEKVVKAFDSGYSQNNYGQCSDAIITAADSDMPHGTNFLHDKTPTCGFDEYFAGTQKPPSPDIVNNGQFVLNDGNVSLSEILCVEQSAHVDDSNASSSVGEPKLIITKEPEKMLSGFGKLSGVHNYSKSSTPQTLLHKLSTSIDDSNPSAGPRTPDAQYSKVSTVTENENRPSCSEKFAELPEWDMVTDEEFMMCEKIASSMIEELHHKQLTSLHGSNKSTGCTALDGKKSMLITATKHENKLSGFGKLIGLYEHPKPVLSVLICSKGSETYICTSCGTLDDNQRTLFMYTLRGQGTNAGRPYFVGHSPMLLPDAKFLFGREIALDKSCMQLTPDGKNVVLLKGMQLPSCRNRLLQCQCLECEIYSCEENGLKIVQLNDGYVTVLAKLKTVHRVLCLLVCEPNYLVAVEANGAFRFWTMDSTWRCVAKEFILPPTDCISPCVIELKQIPSCPHLVVGHNCLGEFGLWDVSRHAIISRFFKPDTAVFRFIPLGLYQASKKDKTFACLNTNEQPYNLKNTSTLRSSQHSTNINLNLTGVIDVAISILVATHPDIKENGYRPMPDGCWKLGLLMNNKVVLKHSHTINARAVTVAALGDCGVLGTNQGYLHVWDLYTGLKLGASLCFKDGRVECLYTDNARSGLLAVADDSGKLLLYSGGEERQTLPTANL